MADDYRSLGFLFAGGVRRRNSDGTTTVYCRKCGRPVVKMVRPTITSISKCQICVLQEQGVDDPEKYVLASYILTDPSQPPIPIDEGDPMDALYPEEAGKEKKNIPQSGGLVGTARAFFRAVVGWIGQEEEEKPKEALLSKKVTKEKRKTTLWER